VSCSRFKDVDAHFAGCLPPRRESAMREHLVGCDACRARYDRHLQLAALDARALPFSTRMALGLGLRRRWRPAWAGAAALAVALGAWLIAIGPAQKPPIFPSGDFDPAALVLSLDGGATEVLGFRIGGTGPALSSRRIHPREELAFAYRNGGGWPRMMIFARDERGTVYWFHPQWTDAATNPEAVLLEQDRDLHELPTAISHRFEGRHLWLCALAVRTLVSVREVESALEGTAAPPDALARKGAVACGEVEVVP
jgi:hypothetical protein